MISREANEVDYPELRQIYLETRRNSFEWANKEAMTLENFDRDTEEEYIVVAEENDQIMGFISLYLPENFIHHLFVHPDFAGRGVGGQLVKAAIEKMDTPLRLKCVSDNHKAMKFYEKNGWKKVIEEGAEEERYWVMVYE